MNLKKGEILVVASNPRLNSGSGYLWELLKIPHTGIISENSIVLDILCPVSKSPDVIRANTQLVLAVRTLKGVGGGSGADAKFYEDINLNTDVKGLVVSMTVPKDWMLEINGVGG